MVFLSFAMNHILNHIMLKLTLCGLACSGLIFYCTQYAIKQKASTSADQVTHLTEHHSPASPFANSPHKHDSIHSDIPELPIRPRSNVQRVIQANIPHVSLTRSIVVFENGTCLFVDRSIDDPISHAVTELKKLKLDPLKFAVKPIGEKDHIVSFAGLGIYHWVFQSESDLITQQPDKDIKELIALSERKALPESWQSNSKARTGLLARYWLWKDLRDLRVIKVLQARKVNNPAPKTASHQMR